MAAILETQFSRELIIKIFQLAVQIGLDAKQSSASEFQDLLRIAFVRELTKRRFRQKDMALLLGVNHRTIKSYVHLNRTLRDERQTKTPIWKVLERIVLKRDDIHENELDGLVPTDDELDGLEVAKRLLIREGIIEPVPGRDGFLRLTAQHQNLDPNDPLWRNPLSDIEFNYHIGLMLQGPLTLQPEAFETVAALCFVDAPEYPRLERALQWLEVNGSIEKRIDSQTQKVLYTPGEVPTQLIPETTEGKVRVGILDLIDRLAIFLETVFREPSLESASLRNFSFEAIPDDIRPFKDRFRDAAAEKIVETARAGGASNRAVPMIVSWFMCAPAALAERRRNNS